ncbi:oligosaccharide flippase family protein [Solirubrobacter sp. CPCC 204708]|uniref:Oligosaccharide flippase family protein n=2 Tax=Solirubrobacter deserti TaxID=2282478 RepID=A0ABT4RIK0_9ACTN|nr:oligosaccharide flippase family protein [Solirubrobacter deserti]MDA0138383.1 oligosaccharide flippase family protein [Solirubrobacter deserti]
MGQELSSSVIRRRAKSGIFFVGSWGVMNLIVGFGGNIVLARLLEPRDFGIVAIGATLMMFTTSIADGGLGSGLIRREHDPDKPELRATLALQLTLTSTLAVLAAAIGWLVGGAGLVVAMMMLALPVAAFQTPGRVVLSRAMRFKALSTTEAVCNLLYYVWSIGLVVFFDAGVWALASAVVIRALTLAVGITAVARHGVLIPSFSAASRLRPVIAFGLRFQGVSLAGMLREQGLNAGIAAIAGVGTLGFWTLTKRLLELPALMFEPLHRVSFPLLSRVLADKQDPARMLDRGVAVASTASGVVLVGMACSAQELVPFVFGEQWRAVGEIIPWICGSLLVAGPLSVVAVGFLYASDAPHVVLWSTVIHTAVLFAVAFPLLDVVGPAAIGVGSLAGAIVDAAIMARAISQRSSARPLDGLLPTVAVAVVAAAAGLAVSAWAGNGVLAGIAAGATGAMVYLVVMAIVRRAVVTDTLRLIGDAVRSGLTKETPLAAGEAS